MAHRSSTDGPTGARTGGEPTANSSGHLRSQRTSTACCPTGQLPMDETVRETLEVAQLLFIDKVVDTLVGAESDLERLFQQTCVSHVRRGSLRGSSSGCCCVCPTRSRYGVRGTSSFQLCRLRQVPAEARGDSSVAVVGKVVHMPVVVSSVSTVQKPSRIPWRFNRCRSWTKLLTWLLLCNDRWP